MKEITLILKQTTKICEKLEHIQPGAFEVDLELDDLHLRGPLCKMSEADNVVSDGLSEFNITVVAEKGQLYAPDTNADPPEGLSC